VLEHEAAVPPTPTTGVDEVLDLGYGRCRLQVQVPANGALGEARELLGRTVVTSFTNLAGKYFEKLERENEGAGKATIKYVGGSVEAACALGVADGIVDLVGGYRCRLQCEG
jgi:ATP phosphoribosyltransferase